MTTRKPDKAATPNTPKSPAKRLPTTRAPTVRPLSKPFAKPVSKSVSKPIAKRPAARAVEPEPPPKRDDLQIGGRLRHCRLLAGILMRELADKVGCTESMISKIESGRVVPSLPMLQRLVDALGRDLASFFGSDPHSPALVLRAGERAVVQVDAIRQGSGVSYERLVPFGAGHLLEGNIHRIEADGVKHDPITHQGETLGYVLEGQIDITVEDTRYTLSAGDSFFFRNHMTNSYCNRSGALARVLWVNTPQVH